MTVTYQPTTITSGTTSDVIPTGGAMIAGLILPASLASTTVTLTACDTASGTFVPVYDDVGTQISAVVASSRFVGFKRPVPFGLEYIKLVFGSSETNKTVKVVLQRVV